MLRQHNTNIKGRIRNDIFLESRNNRLATRTQPLNRNHFRDIDELCRTRSYRQRNRVLYKLTHIQLGIRSICCLNGRISGLETCWYRYNNLLNQTFGRINTIRIRFLRKSNP